jgi:hypothetical protein
VIRGRWLRGKGTTSKKKKTRKETNMKEFEEFGKKEFDTQR